MYFGQNSDQKLDKPYVIFYKRDVATEIKKEYDGKMLFDRATSFLTSPEAEQFASYNLPAVIVKRHPLGNEDRARVRDAQHPYLVAAKFVGKYRNYDYTGDWDPLTTYDAVRCDEDRLEQVVENFAREGAKEIITGIELKIF